MSIIQDRAVDTFVVSGLLAHQLDVLPDALDELAVRADLAGAGPLIDQWAAKRVKRQRARRRWLRGRHV